MLNWAVTFLVIALIAGLLALSVLAGAASQIAGYYSWSSCFCSSSAWPWKGGRLCRRRLDKRDFRRESKEEPCL